MSRSNPHESGQNPAVRWFEWNGERGTVCYYDRDAKQRVDVGGEFAFILLDQLGSVRGWHEPSQSGIYSNEVRDTRQDVLVVKSFKGGPLVEGIYRDIKDRAHAVGGAFVTNCYIAFKHQGEDLAIGSLKFKGSALGAWMEFAQAHRQALYEQAIAITGYTEGKKGRVVYRVPTLAIKPLAVETQRIAVGLDVELQTYLKAYLSRTTHDQVAGSAEAAHVEPAPPPADLTPALDDIPF
jgi:hypothetical protein